MLNGVFGGALSSPLKSIGVSLSCWVLVFFDGGTDGLDSGFPNMPSSSLAELEFVDPSGDIVGGGELRADEQGELASEVAGEERRDRVEILVLGERVEILVLGERVAEFVSAPSRGKTDTPSSSVAPDDRIGLKILFLLFAR